MISRLLDNILSEPGFSVPVLIIGVLMYLGWLIAYGIIIRVCFQQRTYGIPLVNICLNICWEFIFSFNLAAPLSAFFVWGNRLWLLLDCVLLYQLIRFGRQSQRVPWLRENFYPTLAATFVLSAAGLWTFTFYFNDLMGVASAFGINLLMSALFLPFFFSRQDLLGLNYTAAWFKMIGSVLGAVFVYLWWPAQFVNAADGAGRHLLGYPEIPEPTTYSFTIFLYLGIFFLDCWYIWLLGKRRKELAGSAGTAA